MTLPVRVAPGLLSRRLLTLLATGALAAGLHAQTQATTVKMYLPTGVAYDSAGNLYIAVANDNVVRKVDLKGNITTVAGTGEQGFAGDGAAATAAILDTPTAVAVDAAGDIFIADSHNNRIREVAANNGAITTVAGSGTRGFSGDSSAATSAALNDPMGVAVDTAGILYIADTNNHRIRKVAGTTISTVAGNGDQAYEGDGVSATSTGLDSPSGIAVDANGNLFISDTHNQRVREVTAATGVITSLAGTGARAFTGDGAATTSALDRPTGLSVDQNGKVYVADTDNNRVRTISNGAIATLAGDGEQGFAGDTGLATAAILDTPRSTAVSIPGTIALADSHNERVRSVTPSTGIINTVAGGTVDGGLGLLLNGQTTLAYGSAGTLSATFTNSGKSGTGTVTLLEGFTHLATGTLSANATTLTLPALTPGTHTLAASFPGDATNPPVASGVFILTVTPAGLVATANAVSVAYGAAIPALTGTLTGVLPQDAGNVTAVFSTTAKQGSPAGVYPITVTLTGSAAANYTVTLAANSGSLTITPAATTTVLTVAPNPAYLGTPVTLTATVSSSAGTPGGTVTFLDNGVALGTGTLNASGGATLTTNALPLGTQSLTASTAAAGNFGGSTSTAIAEVIAPDPDFTITTSGPSIQSVIPGSSATFTFNVASTGGAFTSPVTFTASGLPPGATVSFQPASLTPGTAGGSFNMTISTPAIHALLHRGLSGATPAALALLLLPLFGLRRRRVARTFRSLTAGLLLMAGLGSSAAFLSGCGSGFGYFGQNPQTYSITVTATGTNVAGVQVQHSTVVTLIVE